MPNQGSPLVELARAFDTFVLYARQWVPCIADAEDAVQEALIAYMKVDPSRIESPKAYFFTCVRHTAAGFARRRGERPPVQGSEIPETNFESSLEQEELRRAVEVSLAELPIEQREILVLKVWGELTFAEIAALSSLSINTVASRYRYGLQKLRENLASANA